MKSIEEQDRKEIEVSGSGSAAVRDGSVAAGAGGVAVGRDVHGNIHIGNIVYTKTEVEELQGALRDAVRDVRSELKDRIFRSAFTHPGEPYRYLDYFDIEHMTVFFGRDTARKALLDQIRAERYESRLTLVHAPSGAGKTSLLCAGIVPELVKAGDLPLYVHHPSGPVALSEPVERIKQAILPAAPHPEKLAALPLLTFLTWTAEHLGHGETLVILLDQFEEFFIHLTQVQKQPFIRALGDCYWARELPVKFVLAMRKDYFADMVAFADEIEKVFHNQFPLPALTREEATSAITEPLQGIGMEWESGAVETLLDYLERGQIEPPHLQLICSRLYAATRESGRKTISVEGEDLRSIHAKYLDDVMSPAPDFASAQVDLGWKVLKRLVTSAGTKQALALQKLYDIVPKDEMDPVLKRLVNRRLLRRDETEGETLIEVAHDTLAEKIAAYETDQERREKVARELVERGVATWKDHPGILMDAPTLGVLDQYRDHLIEPGMEALEFLFRSALAADHDVPYWRNRAPVAVGRVERELFESLEADDSDEAQRAISNLATLASPSIIRRLEELVETDFDDTPVTWVDCQGGALEVRRTALNLTTVRQRRALWALTKMERAGVTAKLHRWTPPGMVLIPAGPFTMGSTDESEEQPVHEVWLDAFWIDRYTVTNAQWVTFLEAIPWERRDLWTKAGWEWAQRVSPEPEQWNEKKNKRDHPVRGICWYDALTYSRWAGKMLLSEAQWEKAARGTDGRQYPWGGKFDENKCNTHESNVEDTSPVGKYSPDGDSPYGVADMAGNVWEWCRNLNVPYPYNATDGREALEGTGERVLRGGSFLINQTVARCTKRYHNDPSGRSIYRGFRVGVAPTPSQMVKQ